jgi:hypothetical protein
MIYGTGTYIKETGRKPYLSAKAAAQNHQYEKPAYKEVLPQRRR